MSERESQPDSRRSRMLRLSWLLDSAIRIPGGFRIGAGGLIGLIPGVGDVIAAGLSSYILAGAIVLRVPARVVMRMILNVLLAFFVGAIPVFGDIFYFAFKPNERNIRLMRAHFESPSRSAGDGTTTA